jgi:hypothetical protein
MPIQPFSSNDFVTAFIGIAVVFAGLVSIILICKLLSLFFLNAKAEEPAIPAPAANADGNVIGGEFISAVSAAIADDMGTEINAIRITSIRKI